MHTITANTSTVVHPRLKMISSASVVDILYTFDLILHTALSVPKDAERHWDVNLILFIILHCPNRNVSVENQLRQSRASRPNDFLMIRIRIIVVMTIIINNNNNNTFD